MRGFIHLVAAIIIGSILLPIGFLYSVFKKLLEGIVFIDAYLYSVAYNINRFSTFICADLYNDTLIKRRIDPIKESKYLFGKRTVSISYHIGKNYEFNSLSKAGKILNKILNFIEKDHTKKTVIKEDENGY